jgi:choline kinase
LIVVGYKKNMIIDYIRKSRYNKSIKIIYNNIFKKTDNAYSLSLALKYINKKTDSIIILDGDIIFDIELFKKMISSQYENVLVADNNRKVGIEDCKVLIEHNHVKDIGKKVEGFAIYTSMIKLGGEFLNKFKSECEKREAKTEWYTEPLRKVLKYSQRELHVIFTEKLLAYEIDTFEDLITARKIYVELIKKVNQKRD